MSHCLNPQCPTPVNKGTATICAACQAPLQFKKYKALKLLGQSGLGRTFLAVDITQALKPRYIIKQLFPLQQGLKSQQKAIALFHQEAHLLKRLSSHPQVPNLYDCFEQNGYYYLVQELIDGQNLSQKLAQSGPYAESQIWQLLADVLPVLKFLHKNQVIHRDIKPDNLIRRHTDGQLFLVDLGAAKRATGMALALTGTIIGSAEYAASEQARGKATFASDIYSVGVTCVHLLTDTSPFNLFDSGEGKWVWQDYLSNSVSHDLSRLLDKMIQQQSDHRYQTVNQLQHIVRQKTLVMTKQRKKALAILQPFSKSQKPQDKAPALFYSSNKDRLELEKARPKPVYLRPMLVDSNGARKILAASPAPVAPRQNQSDLKASPSAKNQLDLLMLGMALFALLATGIELKLPLRHETRTVFPSRADLTEPSETAYESYISDTVPATTTYNSGSGVVAAAKQDPAVADTVLVPFEEWEKPIAGIPLEYVGIGQALWQYEISHDSSFWERKNGPVMETIADIGDSPVLESLRSVVEQEISNRNAGLNFDSLRVVQTMNQAQQNYFLQNQTFSLDEARQLVIVHGEGRVMRHLFFKTYAPEITIYDGVSTIAVSVGLAPLIEENGVYVGGTSYVIAVQPIEIGSSGEYVVFKSILCENPSLIDFKMIGPHGDDVQVTDLFPYLLSDGNFVCPEGSITTETVAKVQK
ncbi:MAG: serine/threonine-protein kinase [Cyanobacteria bacterium P01_F01_bin.150]